MKFSKIALKLREKIVKISGELSLSIFLTLKSNFLIFIRNKGILA